MSDDRRILPLIRGNKDEDLAETIQALRMLVRMAPEISRTRMAFFKAYISEGFTPEQALELCKQVTI